jgi:hypothetical protein
VTCLAGFAGAVRLAGLGRNFVPLDYGEAPEGILSTAFAPVPSALPSHCWNILQEDETFMGLHQMVAEIL